MPITRSARQPRSTANPAIPAPCGYRSSSRRLPYHFWHKQQVLETDFWYPLFICVVLSFLLQHNHPDPSAPQFTQAFAITVFGSIVVTINIKLLGGQMPNHQRS
ncbi:unnamed protein product [Cylicocyclus nassatus]|uniref:Uncharacterized protein n=1 Tax=Cylicocyclus nassatus TaxID=53992 RepID=A0AA36DSF0_CYLNA|nr:unnamed protein product [Cylicocyclus nassatus]